MNPQNPEWYPTSSSDIVYNVDSLIDKITYSTWNMSNSIWDVQSQTIYTYDLNNNLIEKLDQSWNGTNWINSTRYTLSYDANNYLVVRLMEVWQSGTSSWQNWSKVTYTNDANGHILE